jgi:hypothetical protein
MREAETEKSAGSLLGVLRKGPIVESSETQAELFVAKPRVFKSPE